MQLPGCTIERGLDPLVLRTSCGSSLSLICSLAFPPIFFAILLSAAFNFWDLSRTFELQTRAMTVHLVLPRGGARTRRGRPVVERPRLAPHANSKRIELFVDPAVDHDAPGCGCLASGLEALVVDLDSGCRS